MFLVKKIAKMHFKLLILVYANFLFEANAQRVEIPHKNFTSFADALVDAEHFILKFNDTFNFPSLAFGMSVKGKPVVRKTWGRADLENNVAAKLSTKYRIGKIKILLVFVKCFLNLFFSFCF